MTNRVGWFVRYDSYVRIELPDKPNDVVLDFLGPNYATAAFPAQVSPETDSSYLLHINLKAISANAQTMDLTFAVQKTRSVEFLRG